MTILAPDPNGKYTRRYYCDLAYREAWDKAHQQARSFTDLWRCADGSLSDLPIDGYDLNLSDYY